MRLFSDAHTSGRSFAHCSLLRRVSKGGELDGDVTTEHIGFCNTGRLGWTSTSYCRADTTTGEELAIMHPRTGLATYCVGSLRGLTVTMTGIAVHFGTSAMCHTNLRQERRCLAGLVVGPAGALQLI